MRERFEVRWALSVQQTGEGVWKFFGIWDYGDELHPYRSEHSGFVKDTGGKVVLIMGKAGASEVCELMNSLNGERG
jgi:hypothetical protein